MLNKFTKYTIGLAVISAFTSNISHAEDFFEKENSYNVSAKEDNSTAKSVTEPMPVEQAPLTGIVNQPKKVPSAKEVDDFSLVNKTRDDLQSRNIQNRNGAVVNMPPLPNGQYAVPALPSVEEQKEEAFQDLVDRQMPMSPEQIRRLKIMIDEQQRANSELPYTPPKPVVTSIVVNGEPGESPPVIRVAKNFVTTVVFMDSAGNPWPISSYGSGNDKVFEANVADIRNSPNVITLSTGANHAYGNLQVTLVGRPSPIVITLTADQKKIDYLANLRVMARGPNTNAPTAFKPSNNFSTSQLMTTILDGVPPSEARILDSSDFRVQVWKVGELVYLRTKLTVISPSWIQHYGSPDGMHVYEMEPSSIIVAIDAGSPFQIKIGE